MNTMKPKALLLPMLLALATTPALAQFPGGLNYATVHTAATPAKLKHGGKTSVVVTVAVSPGFHINAAKPADDSLIPTKLTLTAPAGLKLGATVYPKSQTLNAPELSPKPMLVYMGIARIQVPVTDVSAKPGKYTLAGTVSFQGCNAKACFPPKTEPVTATITVM